MEADAARVAEFAENSGGECADDARILANSAKAQPQSPAAKNRRRAGDQQSHRQCAVQTARHPAQAASIQTTGT
jgi:hypothetical protein